MYKGVLIPLLKEFFQEIKEEGTLFNSFYEANITWLLSPDKDTTREKKKVQSSNPTQY